MSDLKVQDYNTVASSVLLAALGAAGTPALLAADRPAGAVAQKYIYAGTTLTSIEYYASYDPATQTGDMIATEDFS
jgi:hypothetical protein